MTEARRAEDPIEIPRDLGFGTALGQGRRTRLLRRDGTFAAIRTGLAPVETFGLYHYLLITTWPRFLVIVSLGYLAANAVFAAFYTALGDGALKGGVATTTGGRFAESFFFSVHTLATIGYGNIVPVTMAANTVNIAESLFGLLSLSIVAGVVFARVSRPVAGVRFSNVAVVAPYRGGIGLMFRLANVRRNELIRVHVEVNVSLVKTDGTRSFHALELERQEVVFMPTSWTVVHPITKGSPFYGLDRDSLANAQPEVFALITATEEVFSQVVHARYSYAGSEIQWGARFAPILKYDDDRSVATVDLARLSDVEPTPLPV